MAHMGIKPMNSVLLVQCSLQTDNVVHCSCWFTMFIYDSLACQFLHFSSKTACSSKVHMRITHNYQFNILVWHWHQDTSFKIWEEMDFTERKKERNWNTSYKNNSLCSIN